jgi:hypothetical protein
MIEEQFIEAAISPKSETEYTEKQTMISRELHGMEAVAAFGGTEAHTYRNSEQNNE